MLTTQRPFWGFPPPLARAEPVCLPTLAQILKVAHSHHRDERRIIVLKAINDGAYLSGWALQRIRRRGRAARKRGQHEAHGERLYGAGHAAACRA